MRSRFGFDLDCHAIYNQFNINRSLASFKQGGQQAFKSLISESMLNRESQGKGKTKATIFLDIVIQEVMDESDPQFNWMV